MNIHDIRTAHVPVWKKAGAYLCAGALAMSLVPAAALAADNDESSNVGGAQQEGQAPPDSGADGATPPEMPSGGEGGGGDSQGAGTPPGTSQGDDADGSGGDSQGGPGDMGTSMGGGADTQSFDYGGDYTATLVADGESIESSGESVTATDSDSNAALVQNGGTLTITSDSLSKSGDSSNSDNCNFYGANAGVLAVGEDSSAYVTDTALTTSSEGSNGIFSTDNATVFANNSSVTTTSESGNSRGLDATYGGTIVANRMTISTAGAHSAAIATDRGGGSVSVTNSTLSTSGSGSPLLYSTGDIEVDNVSGTASGSQIASMEGCNSILISSSTLESTNNDISGSDPIKNGVIIYQSTSGDAETSTGETASFTAADSTLKTPIDSGAMFYLTNTTADVVLSNTTLDFDSDAVNLLQVEGNDANNWGSAGANGATVNFTLLSQEAAGTITVDDISSANVYVLDGSIWTGESVLTENSAQDKSTTDSPLSVNVGSDGTWVVTGDSAVTNLNVAEGGSIVDADGNAVSIMVDGDTVVAGDSEYAITVNGAYGTEVAATSSNEADGADIDRSAFDSYYGIDTTFGVNAGGVLGADESVTSTQNDWMNNEFIQFLLSLWEQLLGSADDSDSGSVDSTAGDGSAEDAMGVAPDGSGMDGDTPPDMPQGTGNQGAGGQGADGQESGSQGTDAAMSGENASQVA